MFDVHVHILVTGISLRHRPLPMTPLYAQIIKVLVIKFIFHPTSQDLRGIVSEWENAVSAFKGNGRDL